MIRFYRFKQTDSVTCAITENGLLKSEITTRYYGWSDGGTPTDLASVIGIEAGFRAYVSQAHV